jgi:hypothetical protein
MLMQCLASGCGGSANWWCKKLVFQPYNS